MMELYVVCGGPEHQLRCEQVFESRADAEGYAEKLNAEDRELLGRDSRFPHFVSVLEYVKSSSGPLPVDTQRLEWAEEDEANLQRAERDWHGANIDDALEKLRAFVEAHRKGKNSSKSGSGSVTVEWTSADENELQYAEEETSVGWRPSIAACQVIVRKLREFVVAQRKGA